MNQGPATYFTYRDNQRAFEAIGAWESNEVSITGRGEPEQVEALSVTRPTLPLLRVQPALGRLFTGRRRAGQPAARGPDPRLLAAQFGGATDVVGTVEIDGAAAEIIGVLPASFRFLRAHPDCSCRCSSIASIS